MRARTAVKRKHITLFPTQPSVPFFHFMCATDIHHHSNNSAARPSSLAGKKNSPPAFAGGTQAELCRRSLALTAQFFPPPPLAELLFHSKMASALEPLLSGCIFSLVVVSDSKDFWHVLHGNSTRNSGELNMGRRGYPAALELSSRNPNWTSSSGFLGTARGRGKGGTERWS